MKRGGLAGPRPAMQLQPMSQMQSRGMMAAVAAMGCPQRGGPANYKYGRNVHNPAEVVVAEALLTSSTDEMCRTLLKMWA